MCCRLGDLRRVEDGGHRPHFFLPQGKPTCTALVVLGPLATFTPQVRKEEEMELGAREERERDRGPKDQFNSI